MQLLNRSEYDHPCQLHLLGPVKVSIHVQGHFIALSDMVHRLRFEIRNITVQNVRFCLR